MNYSDFFLTLISFCIGYFLYLLTIPKLKKFLLDKPNTRSSHVVPTPRGGGIIFVTLGVIGSIKYNFILPMVCFPLSIVGFIDDRYSISRIMRYFIQIFTVIFLINSSELKIFTNSLFWDIVFQLILIIALTAIINFVNFMDGIDGLVAISMVLYILIFSFVVSPGLLPLLGALISFLLFNWSPAKVFMGDVGSTFLGAIFAGMLLEFPSWHDSLAFLLIAFPLFADAFICVCRRFLAKENIFKPHKKHLYQRLVSSKKLTHSIVALLYLSLSVFCYLSLILGGLNFLLISCVIVAIIGVLLDRKFADPFYL
tara:strand:- start:16474 stop:17409 length:936 start_codon:yes stop_codon:yes gene_type:complete